VDTIEHASVQLPIRTSAFFHKQNNETPHICQDADVACLIAEIFDQSWRLWPLSITISGCRMQPDAEVMHSECHRFHQESTNNYDRDVQHMHMPVSLQIRVYTYNISSKSAQLELIFFMRTERHDGANTEFSQFCERALKQRHCLLTNNIS
jgi:hypothetical protein